MSLQWRRRHRQWWCWPSPSCWFWGLRLRDLAAWGQWDRRKDISCCPNADEKERKEGHRASVMAPWAVLGVTEALRGRKGPSGKLGIGVWPQIRSFVISILWRRVAGRRRCGQVRCSQGGEGRNYDDNKAGIQRILCGRGRQGCGRYDTELPGDCFKKIYIYGIAAKAIAEALCSGVRGAQNYNHGWTLETALGLISTLKCPVITNHVTDTYYLGYNYKFTDSRYKSFSKSDHNIFWFSSWRRSCWQVHYGVQGRHWLVSTSLYIMSRWLPDDSIAFAHNFEFESWVTQVAYYACVTYRRWV